MMSFISDINDIISSHNIVQSEMSYNCYFSLFYRERAARTLLLDISFT